MADDPDPVSDPTQALRDIRSGRVQDDTSARNDINRAIRAATSAGHRLVVDDRGHYLTDDDGTLLVSDDGHPPDQLPNGDDMLLSDDGTPLLTEDGQPVLLESASSAEGGVTWDGVTWDNVEWERPKDHSDALPNDPDATNQGNPSARTSDVSDDLAAAELAASSSMWTGSTDTKVQLKAIRTFLPIAHAAVGQMIDAIDTAGHNGGPPLDTREDALNSLRSLYEMLGQVIKCADDGNFDRIYHGGLANEVIQYAKRASEKLRCDPMPYATSMLLFCLFEVCGFGDVGGFVSGIAASITRKQ